MKEDGRGPFQSYNRRICLEILTKPEHKAWFFSFEIAAQKFRVRLKIDALQYLPVINYYLFPSKW
jgi:hypothetical protein